MMDEKGRLWLAAAVRGVKDPDFCGKDSDLTSAKLFPLEQSQRQIAMLDPKTMKYTFVDTCFTTHHVQFGFDKNDTLWASSGGGGGVVGWLNTKKFLETGDAKASQGWTALIVDTTGNGKRADYTEPGKPLEPGKDMRIGQVFYAVMPSPVDGTVWGTIRNNPARWCGSIQAPIRRRPRLSEIYNVPAAGLRPARRRYRLQRAWSGCRWPAAISAASTAANAKARSTARQQPAISVRKAGRSTNIRDRASKASAITAPSSSYYTWVDQHNTLGLGNDVPVSTGNLNDGLIAFAGGKMITMKVPYPTGFYAKGLDGRIDDPKAGWKGRGLWSTSGDRVPWHQEGGKGMTPMAVHFQMRPSPLAD